MRIPKDLAVRCGLSEGVRVDIEADGDRLVISLGKPRYKLADLLVGMEHDDLRDAFDWGPDLGREALG